MSSFTEIASIRVRFCAYLIDVAILLIPNLLIILISRNFPLLLYLSHMCVNCSYFTYFISSAAQATPGQKLMKIHTINLNGSKIDLNLAFDRSISQFFLHILNNVVAILIGFSQEKSILASILSIIGVIILLLTPIWYLIAFFSQKKQTYHDMVFGTIVVKGSIK